MAIMRVHNCSFVLTLKPSREFLRAHLGAYVEAVREACCGATQAIKVDLEGKATPVRTPGGPADFRIDYQPRIIVRMILPVGLDPTKFGDALCAKVELILIARGIEPDAQKPESGYREILKRAGFSPDEPLLDKWKRRPKPSPEESAVSPMPSRSKDESAWLIERVGAHLCLSAPKHHHACLWVGFCDPRAWRFDTKAKADREIAARQIQGVEARGHTWVNSGPPRDEAMPELKRFPHCDSLVLHAPGTCEYCDSDEFKPLHGWRKANGINYTGENDPAKKPCPAESRRPAETINRWPGNRPAPVVVRDADVESTSDAALVARRKLAKETE